MTVTLFSIFVVKFFAARDIQLQPFLLTDLLISDIINTLQMFYHGK